MLIMTIHKLMFIFTILLNSNHADDKHNHDNDDHDNDYNDTTTNTNNDEYY